MKKEINPCKDKKDHSQNSKTEWSMKESGLEIQDKG
jgi:hypothetical protein